MSNTDTTETSAGKEVFIILFFIGLALVPWFLCWRLGVAQDRLESTLFRYSDKLEKAEEIIEALAGKALAQAEALCRAEGGEVQTYYGGNTYCNTEDQEYLLENFEWVSTEEVKTYLGR